MSKNKRLKMYESIEPESAMRFRKKSVRSKAGTGHLYVNISDDIQDGRQQFLNVQHVKIA